MKITIGNPIIRDKPKSVYVLTVQTMEGDADDYHEVVKYMTTEDEVKQAILILNKIIEARYGANRLDDDTTAAFVKCLHNDDDWESPFWRYEQGWFYNGDYYDSYKSHELVYFDSVGIEHAVTIDVEPNDFIIIPNEEEQCN